MQFLMGLFSIAPELSPIISSLLVLSVDSVDVARDGKKIAPNLAIAPVIAEFPTNMPAHPVEMINGIRQPVGPWPRHGNAIACSQVEGRSGTRRESGNRDNRHE
jgi:hypothetical protein